MTGKLIVIEGVNGAGKTHSIKHALPMLEGIKYNKGFSSTGLWSHCIHEHPHSLTYYIDLVIRTRTQVIPSLHEGFDVLQDRYVQTVDSFLPDAEYLHNQVFRKLLNPLFLEPNLYIHFTAAAETVAARLTRDRRDEYRTDLASHPELIKRREEKYREIYENLACPKHVIDTTGRSSRECGDELVEIIKREIKC
ncbi:hypothetical protein JXA85_02230 [Candidatus Woesearchaeota archaeon]|nr:hypothetical protein [Candidatus Woesearchaeota archaeon]